MSRLSLVIVLLFLLIALVSPNKVNYNSIASKVAAERGPIFEFGEEVSQLLDSYTDANQDGPEGLFEARILFDDYISNLRDFYTEQFVKDFITVRNDHEQIALIKQRVLRECNSAMKAALPKSAPKDWSYEVWMYL